MKYFSPYEFQGFYSLLDPALKEMLDNFREEWGAPVTISPAPGAVGRTTGRGFHNYKKHGSIKAVDIMPAGFDSPEDFRRGFETAILAGARGIGIYPDWKPQPGMHIDVGQRAGRSDTYVAKWSAFRVGVSQKYYSIYKAFRSR